MRLPPLDELQPHHCLQDTISGTQKPGSRQQCLTAARQSLQAGKSCIIDRTHVTREQRTDFLALARDKGAEVCLRVELQLHPAALLLEPMALDPQLLAAALGSRLHCCPHAQNGVTSAVLACCWKEGRGLPTLTSGCLHALQAHAVVLNLESKLCEQRAEQRRGHEGHLEGPKARDAAKRMYGQLQKDMPSKAAEGLTSIMVRRAASK